MPPQRPVFRDAALAGICAGVGVLANAVKVKLGPKGRLVVLERLFGSPIIAHSGVTVATGIELADRIENMGASMVREVAKKTMEKARDGTTTATMLAQAIVMGGCGPIVASSPPISSCRGKSRWRCRISRTSWCATARFPVSAICCRAGQPAVDHYATKVTHHALANAAFIAGLILTTDCTIAEAPESMREAGGYQISDNLARIIVACAG